MIILRQLYTALTHRPRFFLVLLIAAYVVQAVLAQELITTEEPTLVQTEIPAEETTTPTEVVQLTIEVTAPPQPTTAPPEPTLFAPILTPLPPEPIIVETTIPTLMVEEPATSVLSETPVPTLVTEVSLTDTVPVVITSTLIVDELSASAIPETPFSTQVPDVSSPATLTVPATPTVMVGEPATLTPTVLPASVGIAITASTTHLPQSTVLSASIMTEGLWLPKHFMLTCLTDSTVLRGIWSVPGDLLATDEITVSDSGFQVNGQWQLTGEYNQSLPETPTTGLLWTLNYEVLVSDLTSLLCWLQEIDDSGEHRLIPIPAVELFVEVGTGDLPLSPTVSLSDPLPTPVNISLSGNVLSVFPLDEIMISVAGKGFDGMSMVSEGAFTFDLAAGDYQLIVTAPYHIGVALDVTVSDQPVVLPTIILIGGDIDGNGAITTADTDLISLYYGLAVPPAPASMDLNGDGLINLYDLALVGAGIH